MNSGGSRLNLYRLIQSDFSNPISNSSYLKQQLSQMHLRLVKRQWMLRNFWQSTNPAHIRGQWPVSEGRAANPTIRAPTLALQRSFRCAPGSGIRQMRSYKPWDLISKRNLVAKNSPLFPSKSDGPQCSFIYRSTVYLYNSEKFWTFSIPQIIEYV